LSMPEEPKPPVPRDSRTPQETQASQDSDCAPMSPGRAFVVKALGSCFGLGFLPKAPGTWGSLAAFATWLVLARMVWSQAHPGWTDTMAVALSLFFSFVTLGLGGPAERAARKKDPQWFVLDELAGAFLALYGLAGYNLWWAAGAFLFFRLLDVSKFGAIGWADRKLSGGMGILMDDLFAGAAANLTFRGAVVMAGWLVR